jgi:VanZ family protein
VKFRKIGLWLWAASAIWVIFIFSNSMRTGESSGAMSGSVTEFINSILSSISPTLEVSHRFVRKSAHFLEFAMLSLLFCFAIYLSLPDRYAKKREFLVLMAAPLSMLVASGDECIQVFIDGRGGSVIDVLIDTAGAGTSALCFFLVALLIKRIKKKNSEV